MVPEVVFSLFYSQVDLAPLTASLLSFTQVVVL